MGSYLLQIMIFWMWLGVSCFFIFRCASILISTKWMFWLIFHSLHSLFCLSIDFNFLFSLKTKSMLCQSKWHEMISNEKSLDRDVYTWNGEIECKKLVIIVGQRNHITCTMNTSLTLTFWTGFDGLDPTPTWEKKKPNETINNAHIECIAYYDRVKIHSDIVLLNRISREMHPVQVKHGSKITWDVIK